MESSFDLFKLPGSTEEVEGLLTPRGVNTMASGDKPAAMKFFFYAKVNVMLKNCKRGGLVFIAGVAGGEEKEAGFVLKYCSCWCWW